MQLDNIIQKGVFVGSGEQHECIEQTARDALFYGFVSAKQYLDCFEEAHNEESIDFDRGPIDPMAFEHLSIAIHRAWDKAHAA